MSGVASDLSNCFCLLSENGSTLKEKNLLPKFFSFRADPCSEAC